MSDCENISGTARMGTVIAALWTGNLFAPFLSSGIAAILPAIGASLGGSAVMLSLVMVCYSMGQSISHMLSGRIANMFGVKRTMLIGLGSFCLTGVGLGLVPFMEIFIPLRFIQGVFAATISCTVTTLCMALAPKQTKAQVISAVVSAVYLGLTIGPIACGALTEITGWRTVFFLIAAVGLADILLLWRIIPDDSRKGERSCFDMRSALLGVLGIMSMTVGATCTFLHSAVLLLLPVGLLFLAAFVRREWISPDPILDLKLLARVPGLPDGMAATFINYGSFMGLSLVFSLYLQQVLGLNAFYAGMVLMAQSLSQLFFTPIAGKIADRYPPRIISIIGMAVCGFCILSFILYGEHTPVWRVVAGQAMLGMGAAFFVAPNMAATLGNVPAPNLPVASGLLGCMRTLGGLMSHISVSCIIVLFMGNTAVEAESAGPFLNAMRCIIVLFGFFNLTGVGLSLRAMRHHR